MARYFFHLKDGVFAADDEGQELPNLAAAKDAAVQVLVDILKGDSCKFWDTESLQVIVSDANGLTLLSLDLSATLAPVLQLSKKPPVSGYGHR